MEKISPAIQIESVPPKTQEPTPNPGNDHRVRILDISEYKEAAQCLAEAFAHDDVAWYFLDTPDRTKWSRADKWELHVSILEYIVYAHCLKGLATTVGPNYDSVSLW